MNALYLKGAAFGLSGAVIWASWSAITRLAVTSSLTAWDIAALRFGIAGLFLSPILARRGLAVHRLGWPGIVMIIFGGGVPYALAAAGGLRFAPAYELAAFNPGCIPLLVTLIAAVVLAEKFTLTRKVGLACTTLGTLLVIGGRVLAWDTKHLLGDALALSAALMWACFTATMRGARLDPLHAAALVSTGSLITYMPFYLLLRHSELAQLPPTELAIQSLFQGVLVTIVSLLLYGRAIAILGASGGAAFGGLVPALSALIAIPLLGEWPGSIHWLGIGLSSAGVYLASGGPLPAKRPALPDAVCRQAAVTAGHTRREDAAPLADRSPC